MEDKYKRVSKAQFDIWIDNPVTKTYLQGLKWSGEQVQEAIGNGGFVDSSNNDLSMNNLHSAIGQNQGLFEAASPWAVMIKHEMIEIPEEEED